jgi:hypothetical protein
MAVASQKRTRIVSFVVFGSKELYNFGAISNAELLPMIYPDWVGRFYVADDVPSLTVSTLMGMPHIQVVRFSRNDWPGRSAQLLRFFPASEEGVDAVLVRDSDSRVNCREATCVKHWLATDTRFHIMHESMHNSEYGEIMGGMWGARCAIDDISSCLSCAIPGLEDAVAMFIKDLSSSTGDGGGARRLVDEYGSDMEFLSKFVAPMLTAHNCVHHVDGNITRTLGSLRVPRLPFPPSPFLGFVWGSQWTVPATSTLLSRRAAHMFTAAFLPNYRRK